MKTTDGDAKSVPARAKRAERTRGRIVAAARELCLELGVEGLTMRALAERVDYSPTALYRYFKDKDALVAALRDEAWAASAIYAGADAGRDGNLLAALIAGGEKLYAFAKENPASYRFMISPGQGFPQSMEAFRAHPSFAGLVRHIRAAREGGDLRVPPDTDDELIAFFCFTVVHGAAMLRMGLFKDLAEEWDVVSRRILEAAFWMLGPRTVGQ